MIVEPEMPQVDIIIPLYNKAFCVARAIRSIQRQTFTDWRLIVVDDGSTDNGGDIVSSFEDERIELLRQPNKGPGGARNAGIARATSKYLAFLDADDEWYPWYLAGAVAAIKANDVALVATAYYEWPGKTDITECWAKKNVHCGQDAIKAVEKPAMVDAIVSCFYASNTIFRTDIVRKYDGFYDKDNCCYAEDTTFFLRVLINEKFMVIAPPALRRHREASSLSNITYHPLAPFLNDPGIVLDYCPEDKKNIASRVIAYIALRTARFRARNGFKKDAVDLLSRHPAVKEFRWKYFVCRFNIVFSQWMPYWVKLKCALGPPVRLCVKKLLWKLRLLKKIPDMPGDINSNEPNQ